MLKISANGTDLVGTYFQCHLHDTGFQCVLLRALIFSVISMTLVFSVYFSGH